VIELILSKFAMVMRVPIITRVGLRYIDECPLPQRDTETYQKWYNSSFNFNRFLVEKASEIDVRTVMQVGEYFLRYAESLQKRENGESYVVLDFDAFANNVKLADCLQVTDELHTLIIDEYKRTINAPVYAFMREEKEEDGR
jgi:uncharacterized protein (TIGR04255 family)